MRIADDRRACPFCDIAALAEWDPVLAVWVCPTCAKTWSADAPTCPGCGAAVTIAGRVYCRPSCRVRHQHQLRERQRPQQPGLFPGRSTIDLTSEWEDQ
jgi:hypothetical protein